MEIHLIWAQDINGGIGMDGNLPWHISEDLKNFKQITLNSTIIMGRKTWNSLPKKPLPKRRNIILTRKKINNVETYQSYDSCINTLKNEKIGRVYIVGGRSMYKLFFEDAIYLHITHIKILNKKINELFPISINTIKNKFTKVDSKVLCAEAIYSLWEKNNY